ncbi:dephospho-CoA kinase [Buchnera aphidicola]|uniref:Dephospho-CoA kinase n=1 Tax=Buchnera aphidicola (Lipaphis pseudobrassicae) TaxID=1258543 RepID=A0A4D6Y8B7_9GAMM|nr:dephospho-CoA kinase [Buchnera aphidicola]QCI22080.1 dephospho-CoA kinase [Buchnera aphidicola (Lipaphis pseudobrassicae)]
MTYIVALTGGIGSGKTIVSNSFKKIGINIIDTDIIAKNIIEYNYNVSDAIKKKFGKKILNSNKSINRSILKEYIFNNKNYRLWLENLLHPKIYKESQNQIKLVKSNWCLWVVPLLIEKNLEKKSNRILLVDTPIKTQIKRIIKRDNISLQTAKKIIALQASRKKRISISDDIINNNDISKINRHVHCLNIFYSYLSKKTKIYKKNYLTKFY